MEYTAEQVRKKLIDMGTSLKSIYDDKKDLQAAKHAIRSFAEATRTSVAQIHYKRLTGSPVKIDFLEK